MAFRLKLHEKADVLQGLRRIVRGELERSLRTAAGAARAGAARPQDGAVHAVRKSLKRTRAVLRLLRGELGEAGYHRENFALRDAARPLTRVRDAKVFVDTLAALKPGERAGEALSGAFARVERQLAANRRAISKRVMGAEGAFEVLGSGLTAPLAKALERAEQWRLRDGGWSAIEPGLKRAYRRARCARAVAEAHTTSRRLHEWRKQTKYFLYQLQLLEPSWGRVEKKLAGCLDRLADVLGEDHDLAELRALIEERKVRSLIDLRRAVLEREAFALGRASFEPRPRKVIRQLHDAWVRWHA